MAGNATKVWDGTTWQDLAFVATGPQGPAGPGVAGGGSTGQLLRKKSATNYDTEWVAAAELVTSLPASPLDGQQVCYLANATDGVVWTLRYRAASASSYKWEFVGGGPLIKQFEGGGATSTTSASQYGVTNLADPRITIPLAGDYEIKSSVIGFLGTAVGDLRIYANLISGTGGLRDGAAYQGGWVGGSGIGYNVEATRGWINVSAGAVLGISYLSVLTNYAFSTYTRSLLVRPVRVG